MTVYPGFRLSLLALLAAAATVPQLLTARTLNLRGTELGGPAVVVGRLDEDLPTLAASVARGVLGIDVPVVQDRQVLAPRSSAIRRSPQSSNRSAHRSVHPARHRAR